MRPKPRFYPVRPIEQALRVLDRPPTDETAAFGLIAATDGYQTYAMLALSASPEQLMGVWLHINAPENKTERAGDATISCQAVTLQALLRTRAATSIGGFDGFTAQRNQDPICYIKQ